MSEFKGDSGLSDVVVVMYSKRTCPKCNGGTVVTRRIDRQHRERKCVLCEFIFLESVRLEKGAR
jgi:ribosomal protein S27AE